MPEQSLAQQERDLLRHLTSLVAERARAEAELDERRARETAAAERAYRKAASAAEGEYAEREGALTAEKQRALAQLGSKFEADLRAAKARMDSHLRTYNDRTAALARAANREAQESRWLAETLLESGQSKIKNEFEVARKQAEKRLTEVQQIRAAGEQLLQMRRLGPLPEAGAPGEAPVPAATREELLKAADEARQDAYSRLWVLEHRVRPVLLRATPATVLCVLAALGAGTVAYVMRDPPDYAKVAIWAGGAAVGMLALLLLARVVSRRRVPPAAAALAEAIAEAAAGAERLMRFAESERDRQSVELLAKRDEELAKADRRMAAVKREVARRTTVGAPRLRDRHARRLADIRARRDAAVAAVNEKFDQELGAAAAVRDARLAEAAATRDRVLADLAASDASVRSEVERAWKTGIAEVHAGVRRISGALEEVCPAWSDPAWASFGGRFDAPAAVCFGEFAVDMAALPGGLSQDPQMAAPGPTAFTLPALLDLYDRGSLLVRTDPANAARGVELLRDVMLRLVTAFPPGKVRFTIIDPVGLGQNFAGFMHLADYDEAMVGGKIWTDPKHIEQRLADLTEHMETVIQKYLRNEYETIQEYNRQAGEVAEPYRFLVIADFPANMTEAAAKRLASIASSGARCGLYTLIAHVADGRTRPPAWLPLGALEQSSAVLVWRDGRFHWQNDDFSAWELRVESPPPDEQLTALMHRVGAASKDASRVQVPFEYVAPKPGQLWSLEAAEEVRVPLGRAGAKHLQYFSVGRGTTQHALIAGRTGSGKSTLLHVLITNVALWYSPDEVEMYLVDFKKGVEFKTYAAHRLPHARVIAVESEREFGLSVLRRLDAELTRRGQIFREAGVQDMAAYRRHIAGNGAAGPMPRILLIVDEFQEFFVEDDKLAQEAALLLDRLVRQGRAFGLHVVLGSQTLGGAYSIARSTIGQMAVRIALQCSEADSYLILSEDNAAARLLARPGEAIYNDVSGRVEGNSLFQIVWLPEERREVFLESVRDRMEREGRSAAPPIVFEGNIPADLSRNHLLAAALEGRGGGGPARIWLGDAISIKDPTAAVFRRQSGANLLVVGQQEDASAAMVIAALLSLAGTAGVNGPPAVWVLDGSPADSPYAELLESVAKRVGARFGRVRDTAAVMEEVAAELGQREASGQHDAPPAFLLVAGLPRFRDLRKEDEFAFSSDDSEGTSPAKRLGRVLREGPAFGVHTVAWCDTATNAERMLDRNAMREFGQRVLFQMSAADSTHLIDAPAASTLGRHRALLHSEETGTIEKFRPYAMPDPAWLERVLGAVQRRGSGTGKNV